MSQMTATEASRNFSDLLNRVAAGDEVELTRSGAPVAVIKPARSSLISPAELIALLAGGPALDPGFADDIREIRASVAPPVDPWPS